MTPEDKKKLVILMAKAQAAGIKEIKIEFSGGGDSGGIDEIICQDPDAASMPTKTLAEKEANNVVQNFMTINHNEIESCGYAVLNNTEADFNNDGSQGNMVFYCETGKIVCELGVNYMETRDENYEFEMNQIIEEK